MSRFLIEGRARLVPCAAALALLAAGCIGSQSQVVSAGPRMGVVAVAGDAGEYMKYQGLNPMLSTWGWQFELQYGDSATGMIGLLEFVPMLSGMEQELMLPSMNVLCGVRMCGVQTNQDFEFAVGPYLSPTGSGLVAAIGYTTRVGGWNLPVNLAIVSTREGLRYCFTFGWNLSEPVRYDRYTRGAGYW